MQKIPEKIKQFLENREAISPIVATILVLAVAVAAGVALYYWFGAFQTTAQSQVQNSSTASMNIMAEESLGNEVLKVSLPAGLFEYKSENVDEDNDGKISRPNSTGNYTILHSKYKNNWRDERFIQEIPVYIENRGPKDLTGVTIKYTQLASTLNYLLRIDRNNSNQLLDVNGNPVHMELNSTGNYTNSSVSYYFSEPSYAMNYADYSDSNYSDDSNNYTAYLPIETSMFANNRVTSTKLYSEDGTTRYAIANVGGVKTGWNTASSFFAGSSNRGLNASMYDWAKESLHTPTYTVGTLKPGESKKIYTYYFLAYMQTAPLTPNYCSSGTSFADCTINLPIQVSTDQGASQTVTATMHLVDKDTT
jgi:flagellin-like protein